MTASKHDDSSIERRTKAVHVMHSVCENVDNVPNVVYRTKNNKNISTTEDEQIMLQYLRTLKPFDLQPGRAFFNMASAPSNSLKFIDHKFQQ